MAALTALSTHRLRDHTMVRIRQRGQTHLGGSIQKSSQELDGTGSLQKSNDEAHNRRAALRVEATWRADRREPRS